MLSTILKFMAIVILLIPFAFCSVIIVGPAIYGYNEADEAAKAAVEAAEDTGEQLIEEF